MCRWLTEKAAGDRLDLIHNHSLWTMPNVYAGQVCRRYSNCRLIVSPHGTLSEWALGFHPLRKKVFWHLLQRSSVRVASCFHATGESEYEDIRRLSFTQPVSILPNGVDVPQLVRHQATNRRRQLLFLGRIHPKKGVLTLLRAWGVVAHQFPDWDLHIVGPDDGGHLAAARALANDLSLERAVFRGPLYGAHKLNAYRTADLFVLPTHSENFGISVAEALAAGTPVVVTVGAPWSRLPTNQAGWSIEIGLDPLVACLEVALATPPGQLAQMGVAGRAWMMKEYAWPQIAKRHIQTYEWLIRRGDAPPWVMLN